MLAFFGEKNDVAGELWRAPTAKDLPATPLALAGPRRSLLFFFARQFLRCSTLQTIVEKQLLR